MLPPILTPLKSRDSSSLGSTLQQLVLARPSNPGTDDMSENDFKALGIAPLVQLCSSPPVYARDAEYSIRKGPSSVSRQLDRRHRRSAVSPVDSLHLPRGHAHAFLREAERLAQSSLPARKITEAKGVKIFKAKNEIRSFRSQGLFKSLKLKYCLIKTPKGEDQQRFFCIFGGSLCTFGKSQGYTACTSLTHHAIMRHGEEEVRKIEHGELSYEDAQLVDSQLKLEYVKDYLKKYKRSMRL